MYKYLIRTYYFLFASLCLLGGLSGTYAVVHSLEETSEYHYSYNDTNDENSSIRRGFDNQVSFAYTGHLVSGLAAETDHAGGKQHFFSDSFNSQESYLNLFIKGVANRKPKAKAFIVKDLYLLDCVFLI